MRQCGTNCSFESSPAIVKELITPAGKKKGFENAQHYGGRSQTPGAHWSNMVQRHCCTEPYHRRRLRGARKKTKAVGSRVRHRRGSGGDDTNFESQEDGDSNRESTHEVGKSVHLQGGCHKGTSLETPKKGCYASRAGFLRGA
jgi:hypothetical protein